MIEKSYNNAVKGMILNHYNKMVHK